MDESQKKAKFGLLHSAQSRLFLALALVVALVVSIVYVVHWRREQAMRQGFASVAGAPGIASIPGAGTPSSAYVQAQTQANIAGATEAEKAGTAFVPTITRAGFVGNPSEFGQESGLTADAKQCGTHKVVVMYKPNAASCTIKNLQTARQSGVTAEELICQGCSCPALKLAGYTAGDLKRIGLSAVQLHTCGFDLAALKAAGYSAADLKDAGFTAADLRKAGFTAGELKSAGFSASDLAKAGFTPAEIKEAGLDGTSVDGACDPTKLAQERAAGVSVATLKAEGCGVEALKAAGFSAAQLKAAGFSAAELKNGGFSNAQLRAAGFSPAVIKAADEASAACNIEKLKKERAAGMSATELRAKGCGLSALKAAGFSPAALRAAGFSAAQLKNAGFTAAALKAAGFSAADLKKAGFSAAQLKDAGFSPADLKNAGFSAGQLAAAGYSPKELRAAGFSAAQLRQAGVRADELHDAGARPEELKEAGYTSGDLLRSGYSPQEAGYHEPGSGALSSSESAVPKADLLSVNADSPSARLAAFEKKQQEEMGDQQRRTRIHQLSAYMTEMSQKLLTAWSTVNTQQLQKAPEEKQAAAAAGKTNATGSGVGTGGAADSSGSAAGGSVIKAGSVLFAVIDTSINSDEDTPIMGRIVTGPLNGSKILGTFSRKHKRLLLTFNVLSIPTYPKSIALNAVAIDPDTARTAISGQVNSHYLLRYGTLFASSFLEGVSQGIINQGVTSDCLFGGFGCTLKPTALNTNQQIAVGLGKVGQAYAQHMGQNFNRPPTVRIGAGTGVGLLVMTDLKLPTNALPQPTDGMGMDER